jgi:hypothetical protein
MRILAALDFEEVMQQFRGEHATGSAHEANTNGDGELHLLRAEALLGCWKKVLLGRAEIRSVVLPWHLSEGGGVPLVPKSGLSVAQAAATMRPMIERYATANPVCWRKMTRMRAAPFTPVYLSTEAVDVPQYSELETKHGLIHLDGLHRLVSWELHGLLTDETGVVAYVAGIS